MADAKHPHKMWGGRFTEPLDPELLAQTSSLSVDRRLLRWDVIASIAHAQMLGAIGVIAPADAHTIVQGLRGLLADAQAGRLSVEGPHEDVHSFVEATLFERIGAVAGRLHTARSRNDQVVTAFRLHVKEQLLALAGMVRDLMDTIIGRADAAVDVIMPGFTHLQHAQPVRLAHHLMTYFWMLDRDADRLRIAYRRADALPLGSGALAGVAFPVNRRQVAETLGFARLCENSIDATGDRDFAAEAVFAAALLMIHLSQWGEELVLWASDEFGFVRLTDRVATGSSLMPQKKNPDPVELIRGRAGRATGALTSLMMTLKGLLPGYQRDLQEDKTVVFEALDLAAASLGSMQRFLKGVEFVVPRMEAAAGRGHVTATDVADYLVRKGMAFREAHEVAGQVVQQAIQRDVPLWELPIHVYREVHPLFEPDVLQAVRLEASVEARQAPGGTARASVVQQLTQAHDRIATLESWMDEASATLRKATALAGE